MVGLGYTYNPASQIPIYCCGKPAPDW